MFVVCADVRTWSSSSTFCMCRAMISTLSNISIHSLGNDALDEFTSRFLLSISSSNEGVIDSTTYWAPDRRNLLLEFVPNNRPNSPTDSNRFFIFLADLYFSCSNGLVGRGMQRILGIKSRKRNLIQDDM